MTILDVCKNVCIFIGHDVPTAVFPSTDREHIEMGVFANKIARDIAFEHDWNIIEKTATITGDGVTQDFPLPADYSRMKKNANLWSLDIVSPFSQIIDRDVWLGITTSFPGTTINSWSIIGGKISIMPAVPNGSQVKYLYQTNQIIVDENGVPKTSFTADTDRYLLPERMLEYAIIYKWRMNKGLPYAEHMMDYEKVKAEFIGSESGPRIIRGEYSRLAYYADVAYPRMVNQ